MTEGNGTAGDGLGKELKSRGPERAPQGSQGLPGEHPKGTNRGKQQEKEGE